MHTYNFRSLRSLCTFCTICAQFTSAIAIHQADFENLKFVAIVSYSIKSKLNATFNIQIAYLGPSTWRSLST